MNRDYSYDYLRAFSAIMIVLCHLCQGFGISSELGYYLGGTYVDVFLLLSAYLLGLRYRDKIRENPIGFLRKRTSRLIPTYYTYLSIAIVLIGIVCGIYSLTWKQIVGHYMFLNWFWVSSRIFESPLPQLGHLWFMSAILMGYVLVTLYALALRNSRIARTNGFWILFLVIAACISSLLTSKIRMMVYPCTASFFFILIFYKGKGIMDYLRRMPAFMMISLLVICNWGGVMYYLLGGYDYPLFIFWINLINAFLWIGASPIIFKRNSTPFVVKFISTISFEIYLIHHPFCLGYFSLIRFMPVWMAIPSVLILSIVLGYGLNKISSSVSNLFCKQKNKVLD